MADLLLDQLSGWHLLLKEHLLQFRIEVGELAHQLCVFFVDDLLELSWRVFNADILAICAIKVVSLPVDDIDEAA